MEESSNIEILRRLNHFNEWWGYGKVPERLVKPFRRRDFYKIKDISTKEKITILIGPRRVGKTTLIRQIIDYLIKKESPVNPKNILYAKMDDFLLRQATGSKLEVLMDVYAQNVLKTPFEKSKEDIYVFFDEIHKWENWQQQLKDIFDQNYNIIFLVTGSSSPAIFKGGATALTGRYKTQVMLPMKFIDVLNMKMAKKSGDELSIFDETCLNLRENLKLAVNSGEIKEFYMNLQAEFSSLSRFEKEIELHLKNYMIKGGYPELYANDEIELDECSDRLRDQLQAILTKDILEVFQVRNPAVILDLFQMIGSQTAQIRKYTDLCEKLKITKADTLKEYLGYLKETYLIGIAELFSRNVDTSKKANKKIYVMDVGLRNVSLGLLNASLLDNKDDLGKVVETIVYDHCSRLKFNLDSSISIKPLFYWRHNGYEVDIIMPTTKNPIPIEVKYRKKTERKSIEAFLKRYNAPFGIEVTRDTLDMREHTIYIPLWLFLIIC
jgi:hypothetical protein